MREGRGKLWRMSVSEIGFCFGNVLPRLDGQVPYLSAPSVDYNVSTVLPSSTSIYTPNRFLNPYHHHLSPLSRQWQPVKTFRTLISSLSPGRCLVCERLPYIAYTNNNFNIFHFRHILSDQIRLGPAATGDLTLLLTAIQTTSKFIATNVRRARLINL